MTQEGIEDIAAIPSSNTPPQNRLTINISGRVFETYEETLANFPETLLGNQTKRSQYHDPLKGELFFKQDANCFHAILFYYQSKGILSKPQNIDRATFEKELDFFQITAFYDQRHATRKNIVEPEQYIVHSGLKGVLWRIFEKPFSSRLSAAFGLLSISLVLIIAVISSIETLPQFNTRTGKNALTAAYFRTIEAACMGWFTVEYLIRLYTASSYLSFVSSPLGLTDLVTLVPFYISLVLAECTNGKQSYVIHIIRLLQLVRTFQLFRLARYSDGLRGLIETVLVGVWHIRSILIVLPMMVLFFASVIFYAEIHGSGKKSGDLSDWCWFVVITITTVGYGDIYPVTVIGRCIAVCCGLSGVILFCLVTPTILKYFVKVYYFRKLQANKDSEENRLFMKRIQEMYNDN